MAAIAASYGSSPPGWRAISARLERVRAPEYLRALVGTIGADPVHRPVRGRPVRSVAPAEARGTKVTAVGE